MEEQQRLSREELEKEVKDFRKEKERVRKIIGQIGGKRNLQNDKYINILFLIIVLIVFILGGIFHTIPITLSLEIGVFLVSLKVAYMINSQEKVNHFQFWILTSLEFRLNEISKNLKKVEKRLEKIDFEKIDKGE
ncbi:hypothetical protein EV215_2046 [Hypnocyclicus thermotrophus]|uniref:Uncharacterized protein n=1 Tax=Hypnocyclicus thermotrophus TaxID=1627895 RepID=A0AA46DXG2_9FUSO|nr:hypothetical protein [Hypnocyclicus thermotrophus]TDT67368.1 hypothetical protein EV215_2046 [Hypnocyclicus thermotrophus]